MNPETVKPEILVIDDDRTVGEALEMILNQLGYHCIVFDSVDRGKAYYESETNAIVFLDINMPKSSGLEVLPYLKKLNPKAQVIMMTGERDINNVVTSMTHRATDFLLKPFSIQTVKIALERAVDFYQVLKESEVQEEIIMRDLRLASKIQRKIYGATSHEHAAIATGSFPTSYVSGDFFQIDENGDEIMLLLGDVEDHGVSSGLIGLMLMSLSKEYYRQDPDPASLLKKMNAELCRDIGTHSVTSVCAIVNRSTGSFKVSRAGHPFPILFRKSGLQFLSEQAGHLLGILNDLEFRTYEYTAEKGDILFLYTDGVLNNPESPIVSRLESLVKKEDSRLSELQAELDSFIQSQNLPEEFRDDSSYLLYQF